MAGLGRKAEGIAAMDFDQRRAPCHRRVWLFGTPITALCHVF